MSDSTKKPKFSVGKLVKVNGKSYVVTQNLGKFINVIAREEEATPEEIELWRKNSEKVRIPKKGFIQEGFVPGFPIPKTKVDQEE